MSQGQWIETWTVLQKGHLNVGGPVLSNHVCTVINSGAILANSSCTYLRRESVCHSPRLPYQRTRNSPAISNPQPTARNPVLTSHIPGTARCGHWAATLTLTCGENFPFQEFHLFICCFVEHSTSSKESPHCPLCQTSRNLQSSQTCLPSMRWDCTL